MNIKKNTASGVDYLRDKSDFHSNDHHTSLLFITIYRRPVGTLERVMPLRKLFHENILRVYPSEMPRIANEIFGFNGRTNRQFVVDTIWSVISWSIMIDQFTPTTDHPANHPYYR